MKFASGTSSDRISIDLRCQGVSLPPAIDTDLLWSHCLGNMSFAFSLLGELEAAGRKHVDVIARHAAAADCVQAADAAHALKGAASIIGAEPLRMLASEIEGCGKSQDLARLPSLVAELEQEMQRCLAYIGELRERSQRGSA